MIEAWKDPAATGYKRTLGTSTEFVLNSLILAINHEAGTKIGTDKFVFYRSRWETIQEECQKERSAWKNWKATQRSDAEARRVPVPQFNDDCYDKH